MNKIEKINNIKNIIFGNIKNKSWFKNFKYKKEKFNTDELAMLSASCVTISLGIIAILNKKFNLETGSFLLDFSFTFLFSFGSGISFSFLLLSIFYKIINNKKQKEIDDFIDRPEITNLIYKKNRTDGLNGLVDFIMRQPLEKEEINKLKNLLNENFNTKELNHINKNKELNKKIEDQGCIDYSYVLTALDLLEKNEKTHKNESVLESIKSGLFEKEEEKTLQSHLMKKKVNIE